MGRCGQAKTTQHDSRIARDVPIPEDRRNVVPDLREPGLCWYVCTTMPQVELRAAASLRQLNARGHNLAVYVPCEFEWRRSVRSNLRVPRRVYQRPILRHYLFLGTRGPIGERTLFALRETDVDGRNAHGLIGILGAAVSGPLAMADDGLDWLRRAGDEEQAGRTNRTPAGAFAAGDAVRIGGGPFVGFPARYLAFGPEGETALVKITLMGARTEMRLAIEDVKPVAIAHDRIDGCDDCRASPKSRHILASGEP
ncbi:transcription termination/antitermination protein NusG [Methylobacterium mesophilicum]|uniref:transcription termination/antitermination protein NusG n=1 Tax=Methylobacterium mesophilicum TaxID=39956 RepID=UPI002F357091